MSYKVIAQDGIWFTQQGLQPSVKYRVRERGWLFGYTHPSVFNTSVAAEDYIRQLVNNKQFVDQFNASR